MSEVAALVQVIITAVLSFAATNLDDIFILMLLFSGAQTVRHRRDIALGQLLGVGLLTIASLLGAAGLGLLPRTVLQLLGLVPFCMGLRAWFSRKKKTADVTVSPMEKGAVLGTALLTVANGGDNLGVYLPLFAGYCWWQSLLVVLVFVIMTGVWCLFGKQLAALPKVHALLQRHGANIVPWVLMLLGVDILLF